MRGWIARLFHAYYRLTSAIAYFWLILTGLALGAVGGYVARLLIVDAALRGNLALMIGLQAGSSVIAIAMIILAVHRLRRRNGARPSITRRHRPAEVSSKRPRR